MKNSFKSIMSPSVAFVLIASLAVVFGNNLTQDTSFDQLQSEWEGRIVGGRNAQPGQFPHQVSLRTVTGQHFCGGSVLNANWVLTAAHCTQGNFSAPANIRVVVGAHRRVGDGQVHIVTRIVNHPQYNRPTRLTNDISLIQVGSPIRFNAHVRPVTLPQQNINVNGNIPVQVSGWGKLKHPSRPGRPNLPAVLQFKQSRTLTRAECIRRLGFHRGRMVYENTVCTINPVNKGTCAGDDGGPLITQNGIQIGIVSWGVPCGLSFPDVYASVYHHLGFIRSVVGGN